VGPHTHKQPPSFNWLVNRVITIVGVTLVVLGLVFSFVPLFAGPSKVLTPSQTIVGFNATTSVSLTRYWAIGVSWTSNQVVSMLIVVCHSVNLSASSLHTVCPGALFTVQNGTAGSGTYSVPLGGTIFVGIVSNASHGLRVNVQLEPALTVIGTILLLGGAGVTIVGLLPRRKTRPPITPPPGSPPEVAAPPAAEPPGKP
jgi:hypothetical protein